MLDPSSFFAIFAASIAGSVHCVGMCGGLMLSATGSRMKYQFLYHFARFAGYLSVGGLAGYLGQELFQWRWLPAQILVSVVFILVVLAKVPAVISQYGIRLGYRIGTDERPWLRAIVVGLFTVFLPCGWLYSFVLLAVAMHHVGMGMLVLTMFWLGTLPAMVFSRVILQSVFAKIGVSGKRVVTGVMIVAALISVIEHWKHSLVSNPSSEINDFHGNRCQPTQVWQKAVAKIID